jgi:hypothetical protein
MEAKEDMVMISRYTVGGWIIGAVLMSKGLFVLGVIVMAAGVLTHIVTYESRDKKKKQKELESEKIRRESYLLRREDTFENLMNKKID